MTYSLLALGGQLLGMILIIAGTVLGLHGAGGSEPWVGPVFGIGETVAAAVLFVAGVTALAVATLRGAARAKRVRRLRPGILRPAMGHTSFFDLEEARLASPDQQSAIDFEAALIRWDEQSREASLSAPPLRADAVRVGAESSGQTSKYPSGDA